MNLSKVIERFRELKEQQMQSMQLDETPRDVHLTSLRRQRNEQLQKEEKKMLKQQISNYVKNEKKELWGISDRPPGKMYGNINKCTMLNDSKPILKQKNPLLKRRGKFI